MYLSLTGLCVLLDQDTNAMVFSLASQTRSILHPPTWHFHMHTWLLVTLSMASFYLNVQYHSVHWCMEHLMGAKRRMYMQH